jgi:glycosyltransferase involved in cell wall biosynthesis
MNRRKEKPKKYPKSNIKVAVVTDPLVDKKYWHEQLKCILELFENCELFTPYYKAEYVKENFSDIDIHDSFLQLIAPEDNSKKKWLKLERLAYKIFSFRDYDIVISISSRCARFIRTTKDSKHIAIVLQPHRLFTSKRLQAKEKEAIQKADAVVTNSNSDKRKIRRLYKVNSDVIYPPIDVDKFKPERLLNRKESWFLTDADISTRALKLVIRAVVEAKVPLKIVGPLRPDIDSEELIKEMKAKGLVKFLGKLSEENRIELLQRCKAYIYPKKSREFGRVAVEANAAGTAVIAYRRGAVIETISENHPKTGVFFQKYNYKSLAKVLKEFNEDEFDSKNCIMKAQELDTSIFMYKLKTYVEDIVQSS